FPHPCKNFFHIQGQSDCAEEHQATVDEMTNYRMFKRSFGAVLGAVARTSTSQDKFLNNSPLPYSFLFGF
ncbi:MAG: hypothetical protein NTX12_08925, partial [Actinobacteria bacterium]|nr:hypothetical protein [Actinomycetota bacterium]